MADNTPATEETYALAAETLWSAWAEGDLLDGLPEELRPQELGGAYKIQSKIDRFGGKRLGWKLAATGAGGRTALGVDQPLAGPLYTRFKLEPGDSLDFSTIRMHTIEGEFGLQLVKDLPATGAPYEREAILPALGAFVPAIEVPNTRYLDHRNAGAVQLTADSALAGFFVLGTPITSFDPESLPGHPIVLHTPNGDIEGTGAKVLGDPVEAVRWLANELGAHGIDLHAGDTVITGAAAATREPGVGEVVADFGPLGQVSLNLS